MRVPKLDPELEKVLADWELHTARFKDMTGDIAVFKYDHTFEVEKRAIGKFAYEAPDKGNYELKGIGADKDEVSKQIGKDGTPYAIKSEQDQRWVCNGKKVIRINEKEKTFEEAPIPPESQGQNIIEGPLPFLFGMKAERAKRRYRDFKLVKKTETEIRLRVRSKEERDVGNWDTAVIIIDAKEFIPKAVKLTDATGAESVHVFKNVVINPKRGFLQDNPFKPNLNRYKLVVTGKAPPPAAGSKKSSAAADSPLYDLGRTAESTTGNPSGKKTTTVNRK
jgi:TIGR03009 family protein